MRPLVMGGTEFIGLHLVQSLVARGHEVTVFARAWYRSAGFHERPIDASFEDGLLAKIAA